MEDSKFNLWRATFSFCFVDGFLSPEETAFIEEKVKVLPFTAEQKEILMMDLKLPPGIDNILPLITSPADRGFLINNIRLLSRIDNLSPAEKSKIEELTSDVLKKINLAAMTKEVNEEEVTRVVNKNLYSETIMKRLMRP